METLKLAFLALIVIHPLLSTYLVPDIDIHREE